MNLKEDYPTNFIKDEFQKIISFAGKYRYAAERLQKLQQGAAERYS
jgi:hypothetical protein